MKTSNHFFKIRMAYPKAKIYELAYTQATSKIGISAWLKPWDLTILNGSIFLILNHLRSSNRRSFRGSPNLICEAAWV
jgi:hypothetical protein